jgi:hypothetical protein
VKAEIGVKMRTVPPREWLAALLPPVFGFILLTAGAVAAAHANAWGVYALAAGVGLALPLVYTLELARRHRLFLRSDAAVAQSRSRIATDTDLTRPHRGRGK